MPSCEQALVLHSELLPVKAARNGMEKIHGNVANYGEVLGRVTGANAAVVFPKCDVENQMELVFDSPVASRHTQHGTCQRI